MSFETPGYDEILDLYIAYGYVECLIRAGVEEITLIPKGRRYVIETNNPYPIEKGIVHALEDMLALHKALGRYSPKEGSKVVSNVDFSAGANINNVYWDGVPKMLDEIKNTLKSGKTLSPKRKITIPMTTMPSAGKFMPKRYGVEGGNPVKADSLSYALAWIGFHYYTSYLSYTKSNSTWVHIYALKPLEPLGLVEVLALKDLKKPVNSYYEKQGEFLSHRRQALLYHITHTESLGALEVLTGKRFTLLAYTLEKAGNNQAIRSYNEEDISKLIEFLWRLKAENPYYAVRFIDNLLRNDLEFSTAFIEGILYDKPDGIYTAIRGMQRSGKKVPQDVISAIQRWLDES